jgi:hypothetical protein
VGADADVCEHCQSWLLAGRCAFCLAAVRPTDGFCGACGNPPAGRTCGHCGAFGCFHFCAACGQAVTAQGVGMLAAVAEDPDVRDAVAALAALDALGPDEAAPDAGPADAAVPAAAARGSAPASGGDARRLLDRLHAARPGPLAPAAASPARPATPVAPGDATSATGARPLAQAAWSQPAAGDAGDAAGAGATVPARALAEREVRTRARQQARAARAARPGRRPGSTVHDPPGGAAVLRRAPPVAPGGRGRAARRLALSRLRRAAPGPTGCGAPGQGGAWVYAMDVSEHVTLVVD